MTSRMPAGAATRADLFGGSGICVGGPSFPFAKGPGSTYGSHSSTSEYRAQRSPHNPNAESGHWLPDVDGISAGGQNSSRSGGHGHSLPPQSGAYAPAAGWVPPIAGFHAAVEGAPSSASSSGSSAGPPHGFSPGPTTCARPPTLPATVGDEGPLELEHVLAFTGHHRQTAVAHPTEPGVVLRAAGPVLAVSALSVPHGGGGPQQELLRAHDMEISALAVSPDGALVATGQIGSTHRKGYPALIVVWDFRQRQQLRVLSGLTEGVVAAAFTPDGRLLTGVGADRLLYVWDVATGEILFGKRHNKPVDVFFWSGMELTGKRPIYHAVLCVHGEVSAMQLVFDPARQQWHMTGLPMTVPSSGLSRKYTCGVVMPDGAGGQLLCGTTAGEMIVFRLASRTYRASIPVGTGGGLLSICLDRVSGAVVCGCGDGSVTKLEGSDMLWRRYGTIAPARVGSSAAGPGNNGSGDGGRGSLGGNGGGDGDGAASVVLLDGPVVALSTTAEGAEIIAATAAGSVYRLLAHNLTALKVSSAHTAAITAVACCPVRATDVATADVDGSIRFWDLSNYACIAVARLPVAHHLHTAAGDGAGAGPGHCRSGAGCIGGGGTSGTGSRGGGGGGGGGTIRGGGGGGRGGALCLCWVAVDGVASGWADGAVRCFEAGGGRMVWEIAGAHRGAVTAVAARGEAEASFLVSGAADGAVRVWSLRTRQMTMQFCEHSGPVAAVLPDNAVAALVHSAGRDCAVLTYDLHTQRRTVAHLTRGVQFAAMAQKRTGERELVTADASGNLLWWDCDVRDPVQQRALAGGGGGGGAGGSGGMGAIEGVVPPGPLRAVAASPCGRFLAVCGETQLVQVVDAATGASVAVGAGHAAPATTLQWTIDGRQIVSGDSVGTLCVWNVFA